MQTHCFCILLLFVVVVGRSSTTPTPGPCLSPSDPAAYPFCAAAPQTTDLASDLVQKMPAAALAGLVASLGASPAFAVEAAPPPPVQAVNVEVQSTQEGAGLEMQAAPEVKSESGLPEGNQWRYSEFVSAGGWVIDRLPSGQALAGKSLY